MTLVVKEVLLSVHHNCSVHVWIRVGSSFVSRAVLCLLLRQLRCSLPVASVPFAQQGIVLVKHHSVQGPAGMVRLWMHEMSRVFGDRLADPPHLVVFEHMLIEAVGRSVSVRLSTV